MPYMWITCFIFLNTLCTEWFSNIDVVSSFQNGGRLHGPLQGVPMVATSPVRHESPMQANPVEVQSYQPPWKALSEFAMQSELEHPPFQQLVSSFVCDVNHDDDDDDHVVCYDQCWLVQTISTWYDPPTHGKSHLK